MKQKKKDIIKSLAINKNDVGSAEVQIGLLSDKIENYQSILKNLKKINILRLDCLSQLIKRKNY